MENNSSFLRKIVVVVLIFLFFVLQCSVFNSLALGGIIPNLMIILTSSFGFMRGEKEGLLIGFSCGLFFWKLSWILCHGNDVHRIPERKILQDFLSGGYQTAVGTDCSERYFLWIDLLYSDVSFERAFSFPVLFYKSDPSGGTLHHCCYDYFVSSDPEDQSEAGGEGKKERTEICFVKSKITLLIL